MIFPFQYGDDADLGHLLIPENQACTSCGKAIRQNEKSIQFHCADAEVYFHVKCAEHVALMIMRDVAECRCGREVANAKYRLVREIVPHRNNPIFGAKGRKNFFAHFSNFAGWSNTHHPHT
jgi:hypothetical protein